MKRDFCTFHISEFIAFECTYVYKVLFICFCILTVKGPISQGWNMSWLFLTDDWRKFTAPIRMNTLAAREARVQETGRNSRIIIFHNFRSAPGTSRVTKSRRMGWAGRVTHVGETRYACACRILVGHLEGKRSHGWDLRRIQCDVMKTNQSGAA
jgi:hypothetical protein